MERHVFVVDPLPNVSAGVRKTLSQLRSPDLTLIFENPPLSMGELRTNLGRLALAQKPCALVIPLNGSSQTPVLQSFRQETGQPRADAFDLMVALRKEWAIQLPASDFPFLMPFLTIEKPAAVLQRLVARPELTHVLACLTSHILGTTGSIGKNEVIDEGVLMDAFRRHFTRPQTGPFLMKDFVLQVQVGQTS